MFRKGGSREGSIWMRPCPTPEMIIVLLFQACTMIDSLSTLNQSFCDYLIKYVGKPQVSANSVQSLNQFVSNSCHILTSIVPQHPR
jgi:hypothetical protein